MRGIIGVILLTFAASSFATFNYSPTGLWRTIDDHSKQPASLVKLWIKHGKLFGKVIKIYSVDGNKPTDLCRKCPGRLKNRPIQGITFLWNMKHTKANIWSGGQIMDPKTGSIYRCRITVSDNEKYLKVRGFIGIPLLGRTQTWYKVS